MTHRHLIIAIISLAFVGTADAQRGVKQASIKPTKRAKSFRPNQARRPTHDKPKLVPRLEVITWGKRVTKQNLPQPRPPRLIRDPFEMKASGAPRDTRVELQKVKKSADIELEKGTRPNQSTVARAQRWARPFESFTTTAESPTGQTSIIRPKVLDAHTPIKATFKDPFGRTVSRVINAKGLQTRSSFRDSVERGRQVRTTTEESGTLVDAYKPFVNTKNMFVTRASVPAGAGDYKHMASMAKQRIPQIQKALKTRKGDKAQLRQELQRAKKAISEANRESRRLARVQKTIRFLDKKIQTTGDRRLQEQMIAQRDKLEAQLAPGPESSMRFVALAAFPPNATVTVTNLRMEAEGARNAQVSLVANGSGSVSGSLPAWQNDRVRVEASYPEQANRALGSNTSFTFTLPTNSTGSASAFKKRGVRYLAVDALTER